MCLQLKMEASGKHDFVATADDELSFSKGAKLKVCYFPSVPNIVCVSLSFSSKVVATFDDR